MSFRSHAFCLVILAACLWGCGSGPHVPAPPVEVDLSCVHIPSSVELPQQMDGCSAAIGTAVLSNGCAFPVRVLAQRFEPSPCADGKCPTLALVQSPAIPKEGALLQAGEQHVYRVRPIADHGTGVGEAHLRIDVEAQADGPKVTAKLGTRFLTEVLPGTPVRGRVEYYKYASDVLFIVDTSPRMREMAPLVRAELESVMRSLYTYWRPIRVAITTATDGGAFITEDGTAAMVDVWEPDAVTRLLAKFDTIEWNATAEPRPLEAMVRAVTPPLSEAQNAGFGAPNRASLVYIITNGDDHSSLPVEHYLQTFFHHVGPWSIQEAQLSSKVVAIYPMSGMSMCSDAPMTGRLDELTISYPRFTGWHPICLPHDEWKWFAHMFVVWDAEVRRRYCLPPIDARRGIRVWLDGIELSQGEAGGDEQWRYDSVNNCIVLIEPDDRTTVVEYEYWLAPECG